MEIIEWLLKKRALKITFIVIISIIIVTTRIHRNLISNALYYAQHTPYSKSENIFGIVWSRYYKYVNLKRMRYRGIKDDAGILTIHLGKYHHNKYPSLTYAKNGEMYLDTLSQGNNTIYTIDKYFKVTQKSSYNFITEESEESTDITKEDIEEVKKNIDLLMTPILKEIKEPVINLQ